MDFLKRWHVEKSIADIAKAERAVETHAQGCFKQAQAFMRDASSTGASVTTR